MQLSKVKSKSLFEAVRRDRSKAKLSFLWEDCCWRKEGQKKVKLKAGDQSVFVMQLVMGDGVSGGNDAGRCFIMTIGTTSARMTRRKSSCRAMH